MNEFDLKAAGWDQNPMHWDRSAAIVKSLLSQVPVKNDWNIIEFGAGTGITSFMLKDLANEIVMMDTSAEMVKTMKRKVAETSSLNLKPQQFDLEKNDWKGEKFNLLITQMVLHHVLDLDNILQKFFKIILPGGYLAIADLYPEDGSFHGEGFTGYRGFDTDDLADLLRAHGFVNVSSGKCFRISRKISETESKGFDVFLMIAFRAPEI